MADEISGFFPLEIRHAAPRLQRGATVLFTLVLALSFLAIGCTTTPSDGGSISRVSRGRSTPNRSSIERPSHRTDDAPAASAPMASGDDLSFVPRALPAPSGGRLVRSAAPLLLLRDEPFTNAYCTYEAGRPIIVLTRRLGYLISAVCWRGAEEKLLKGETFPFGALLPTDISALQTDPYHVVTPRGSASQGVRALAHRYAKALSTYVLAHEYGHLALGHLSANPAQVGADNEITRRARLRISRLQELEADSAAVSIANSVLGHDDTVQGLVLNTSLLIASEHILGPSDPYTSDHPYWKDRLDAMLEVLRPRPSSER